MSSSGPKLTISADAGNVGVARTFVTAGLEVLQVHESHRDKMKLVTSELVTQLIGQPTVTQVDVEITEGSETTIVIGSAEPLPTLPDDVVHILDSLTGIHIQRSTRSWIVRFESV